MGHAKSKPMKGGEYKEYEKQFITRLQRMAAHILEHKDCLRGKIRAEDMALLKSLSNFTTYESDFEFDIKWRLPDTAVIHAEDKPVVTESAKAPPKFRLRQSVIYYKKGIAPISATVEKITYDGSERPSYLISSKYGEKEVLESSLTSNQ